MGAHILGNFASQPNCQLPESYFTGRDCWVDCRVPNMLYIHSTANIGWEVHLVCQTHNTNPGMFGETQGRPIKIGANAFIGAFATLYNCDIGEGSIVAVGSVVRSQDVPPWTMVEGNPARPIKRYDSAQKAWVRI